MYVLDSQLRPQESGSENSISTHAHMHTGCRASLEITLGVCRFEFEFCLAAPYILLRTLKLQEMVHVEYAFVLFFLIVCARITAYIILWQ